MATELAFGLGIALLLNIDLPWIGFFRTALVVPMMITPIVAALCWKLLLDPDHGVVNYWIGSHIVWLGRPGHRADLGDGGERCGRTRPMSRCCCWPGCARCRASRWRRHRSTAPAGGRCSGTSRCRCCGRIILVALLLRTIFEFRAFDNIYVMTSGGPANATMSLSMFTYLASFVQFDLSLGAAASWLMLLMCLLLCAVLHRGDPPAGGELMSALSWRRIATQQAGCSPALVYLRPDRD